jgi:hypothetical protein
METTITLPLREYIDTLIGFKEASHVSMDTARRIHDADPNEECVHLQFLLSNTDKPVPNTMRVWTELPKDTIVRVWHIKDWKRSSERYEKQKQEAEHSRKEWEVRKNNLELISKILSDFTGLGTEFTVPQAERLLSAPNCIELLRKMKPDIELFTIDDL